MFALLSLWGGSSMQAPLVTMPVISVPDSTWMQRYTLTRHWPPVSELQHSWDAEMQASARCVEAPQTLMDPHGFFFFFFSFICVHFLLKMSSHESLLLSNWNLSLLLLVAVPLNSFLLLGSTSSDHRASILTEGLSATCYSFTLKQDKPAAKNWTATDSQFVQTIQNTSLSSRTDLQVCVCVCFLYSGNKGHSKRADIAPQSWGWHSYSERKKWWNKANRTESS